MYLKTIATLLVELELARWPDDDESQLPPVYQSELGFLEDPTDITCITGVPVAGIPETGMTPETMVRRQPFNTKCRSYSPEEAMERCRLAVEGLINLELPRVVGQEVDVAAIEPVYFATYAGQDKQGRHYARGQFKIIASEVATDAEVDYGDEW